MMKSKILSLSALALSLMSFGMVSMEATAAPNKTLKYCLNRTPKSLSPQLAFDGSSFNSSSRIIFNRLVETKPGSLELENVLAESIDVSPDALEYTVHVRPGVKFNDNDVFKPTRNLNADDVVFSVNRMLNKEHPYHKVNNPTYPQWYAMGFDKMIKSVEKVDDMTVKFTLTEPNVTFISNLALDVMSIYSKEYADQLAQKGQQELIDTKPIGTGPWKLRAYTPDVAIRYQVNPNYFKGASPINNVIFTITPDSSSRISKLISGACDIIDRPETADLTSVVNKYNLKLVVGTGLNTAYIALNNEYEPLKKVEVRKALDMAIDKKAIASLVYNNDVVVDNHFLTSDLLGYDANEKGNPYNPELAKELLAKAGYANGLEVEIFVQPISRSSNPNPRRTAELIQQDWEKIGVKTTLRTTEFQDFVKQTRAGNYQAGTYGWSGDNGDTDNFFGPLLGTSSIGQTNYARFSNAELDRLIQLGRSTPNTEERRAIYQQAEKIFFNEQPLIIIGHSKLLMLMNQKVLNYKQTPTGFTEFYGVDLADK